jgi:hypothetical protein
MKALKKDIPKPDTEQKKRISQINADVSAAAKAIAAKRQQTTMMSVNRIIRVAGVLASGYAGKVPQPLWQMQYLSREIGVWSTDPGDIAKLKSLPARFDAEWSKIGKSMEDKSGNAMSQEYLAAVAKLKTFGTVQDFAKSWKSLLESLNKMETDFVK